MEAEDGTVGIGSAALAPTVVRDTIERAHVAKSLGAAMVMMPPPNYGELLKCTAEQICNQIAQAGGVGVPIPVQDAPLAGGDLPVPFLVKMAQPLDPVILSYGN